MITDERATEELQRELESLFEGVARDLFDVDERTGQPDKPGLIFPFDRERFWRISEQEAKQLFLFRVHSDRRYRFSVETPTCEPHGTGRKSALVDVSLFACNPQVGAHAHVEFKGDPVDAKGIRTSLEKLVREEKLGGWFHTLGSTNKRTVLSLRQKYISALADIRHCVDNCKPHLCLFAVCVVRQRLLFLRWVTLGGENSFQDCEHAFRDLTLNAAESSSWIVSD
jgi:hypothetical protein